MDIRKWEINYKKDTWISPGAIIHTHSKSIIVIGNRCDVGPSVEIMTGSHEIGSRIRRAAKGTTDPVFINDGVWIGARTLILGGVTIDDGVVVAAGSVVNKSIECNSMVAGVPAKVKYYFTN